MKKFAKKFLVAAMACMLAVTTVAPMTAEAAPSVAKTTTVYLRGKNYSSYVYLYINGYTKGTKITDVKSSKNTVASPYRIYTSSSSSKYDYIDESYTDDTYESAYAEVTVYAKKAGTTKVSFKVGNKTLSTTLKVLNYTNPLKTANILGIKNGGSTNLASKVKNSYNTDVKLTKAVNNGKITFTAAKGWKITGIDFENETTGTEYEMDNYNGLNTATLYVGKMTAKQEGRVYVSLMNTKNKATQSCYFYIND